MILFLKFLPALLLGLLLSLGTLIIENTERTQNLASCEICPAFAEVDFNSQGFPFKTVEDKLRETESGQQLATADNKYSSLNSISFVANWAVWSVVAFAILFVIKKLRYTLGVMAMMAIIVLISLIYFGGLVIA